MELMASTCQGYWRCQWIVCKVPVSELYVKYGLFLHFISPFLWLSIVLQPGLSSWKDGVAQGTRSLLRWGRRSGRARGCPRGSSRGPRRKFLFPAISFVGKGLGCSRRSSVRITLYFLPTFLLFWNADVWIFFLKNSTSKSILQILIENLSHTFLDGPTLHGS